MTVLSDYVSGTISLTTGSVDFTGSATGWLLAAFKEGDTIIDITGATEFMGVIAEITSNTAGKLTKAWEGPNLVDAPYRMRYQADGSRVSAQARNLIELLGDGTLTSLAGLTGPGVIELLPGGGAQVVPKTDLVSGANYDVQVSDLAGRAVYDGQAEGFSVLVADVGDGRSAIYSKASNASADWTDPAYVTGPIGETPDVTVGTVTTGAPGTDVEVTATPSTGGVELDFTIPAGEGFSAKGAYSGATAYAKGDVVRDAGSSWIALQATTGNAPPTLPTTSNAYWELLAQKGQDGLGTISALEEGDGISIDVTDPNEPVISVVPFTGDSGSGGAIGAVPAPAAGDAATKKFLRADGTWAPISVEELEFTVSQLALGMADALNVAQFLGPSGNRFADSFDALTYVDVAGATNLDTSAPGSLKATTVVGTATASVTHNADSSQGAKTQRQWFAAAAVSTSGNYVRVRVAGPSTGTPKQLNNVFIGHATTAPNFDAVPVRVTFGGLDAVTPPAGSSVWSDWVAFAVDETKNLMVSFDHTGTNTIRYLTPSGANLASWEKASVSEAGTQTVTGYGSVAQLWAVAEVQVKSTLADVHDLTVRSTVFTAAAGPAKMKALINVKEVEAAVAGTDYTLECSRDNGTTWTAMTLTERYTMPTTSLRVVEAADTDVSGQPNGSAPRWRFKTFNNKNVELHDVYFYWS